MFSVLLLGATGTIGTKIAYELGKQRSLFKRVAFLTSPIHAGPEKEAKYSALDLERVIGSLEDSSSYLGFDIVVSAVGDALCLKQPIYIEAAFEAGVKHFYPAEYGSDLIRGDNPKESYYVNKILTRKYLEARVVADPSLGFTFVMTGLFSDFLLQYNLLFLSDDKKSAEFSGLPDALLTVTDSDDVAKFIVASLLPEHLKSISGARQLRFSGTTTSIAKLFEIVSSVIGNPIEVRYGSREQTYIYAEEQKALGNIFNYRFSSARRSVGYGDGALLHNDNSTYLEIVPRSFEVTTKKLLS